MQLSINYLSELTGIDRRRVTTILRDLPSTQGPHRARLYDSLTALPRLFGLADGRLDPTAERAALDKVRREIAELDRDHRRGELVPVSEVASAWSEQIAIAKGRLLALPNRVSSEILRLKTQREIERALRDSIIKILEELAADAARYGLEGDEKTL